MGQRSKEPFKIPFSEMEEWKLYKNVNTYNDQWYMRVGNKLMTCSAFSKGKFSESSASRTGHFFVAFEEELTRRV